MSWEELRAKRIQAVWRVIGYTWPRTTAEIVRQVPGSDVLVSLMLLERKGYVTNLREGNGPSKWVRVQSELELSTIKEWL